MLDVNKLVASAESCLGWPYVSPGTNDQNGIDCSGLLVKIFRDQGASIYHGSNTIFREYCKETGKLTSEKQLQVGMVVFKRKDWTNADKNNKWYGTDPGNMSHIGFVAGVNPLRIIHASTGTMCVTTDTKITKWAYWGKLKNVDYGSSNVQQPGGEINMTAMVTASNGVPVNMRKKPDIGSAVIRKVPVGATVEVNMKGTEWTLISYSGDTGYMMTKYLNEGSKDMITVERSVLQEIVDKLNLIMYG